MAQGFTEDTPRASDLVQGKSKLSVAPVDPYVPIAVGDNDPRLNALGGTQLSYFTGYAFAIWSGSGLIFDVIAPVYYLGGNPYPADSGQITLDPADPTNARFDAIIVDEFGINKITGTPSPDPVLPSVNPLTQLVITYISIPANATTPAGITDVVVYNENAEWTPATNNGTVTFGSSSNPFVGTVNIDSGSFNDTHYIRFTAPSPVSITSFNIFRYHIRLKSAFTNITYLKVRLYSAGVIVSNTVSILDTLYGFNRLESLNYQIVVIPITAFTMTTSVFDRVEFIFNSSNANGFEMDYITFQGGVGSGSSLPNFFATFVNELGDIVSPTTPSDTITFVGAVKTGPKEWTFSGGGHEILDEAGTPLAQEAQLQFVRLDVTADTGKTVVTRPADTFVGISPPSSPVEGDIWTDTNDTVWKTYVRYDGYWVEQIASGGGTTQTTVGSQLFLYYNFY